MTLGERLKVILTESNETQVDFAKALGIGAGYVNQLVNGKKTNISHTLAKLIEETYGYSADWIMTGKGEKRAIQSFSLVKLKFLKKVQNMPEDEVIALLAFANSLESIKEAFGIIKPNS